MTAASAGRSATCWRAPPATTTAPSRAPLLDIEGIARALDPTTASAIWSRFRAGQRGIMVRSIYTAEGRASFDEVSERYGRDADFRRTVDRFLADFERLCATPSRRARAPCTTTSSPTPAASTCSWPTPAAGCAEPSPSPAQAAPLYEALTNVAAGLQYAFSRPGPLARTRVRVYSAWDVGIREGRDEVRHLLRAAAAAALAAGRRAQALSGRARAVELADRLGYDYAWVVEHHFLEEYSHCSAPEVFLAAASQRTKSIRLGHGIFQLTTNHPTRVAERVAVLDLLSNGRVEFGMGESASITELEPFGRSWRTSARCSTRPCRRSSPCSTMAPASTTGKYFDFPYRNVLPKPCRSRTRLSGWRARSSTPSRGRGVAAWVRWLPVRQRRCGACLGARLLQRHHQAPGAARRLP